MRTAVDPFVWGLRLIYTAMRFHYINGQRPNSVIQADNDTGGEVYCPCTIEELGQGSHIGSCQNAQKAIPPH